MLRLFLLFMLLTSFGLAEAPYNKSNVRFTKDAPEKTLKMFYEFAVDEYEYANYGFSRDLFVGLSVQSDKYPGCYYFLGKIYEEVALFKDLTLSKQCYLRAATSKKLASHLRQDSYIALIRLTDDPDIAIKYALDSNKLEDSDIAKKALILAYHKKYDNTRDEAYLTRAEVVNRSMNDRFFNQNTQPTILFNSSMVNGR